MRLNERDWETEIEIQCYEHDALQYLEDELGDDPGVSFREGNVYTSELRSDLVHTIIIAVSSTGFTSAASATLIQFIKSRRAKITVRRSKTGTTVTYEGPVKDGRKVMEIVNHVSVEQLPE
ncbi:hypothetical protein GCM10010293_67910 [Streptomyces griseoflavus]|uniref:effector-associated constant component EACC1 n=1 Tax=Streptomyces griseoflavus TaxID=35619 RepID=UPI00167E09E3|nr:hypothetical protein [Streptomyces griseoflavus]GGV54148.1 hypothetical protein GCM10010293_67910 [Streptomyces griseoflavus]